jgi:asparagine synthase (glutamine-hydrolysing)
MCAINGIFAYREHAPAVDEAELLRVREAMAKRGPDGAGAWISPDRKVGLANRRLAIIDLSAAGAQPMATPDGRLRVTFNGEIYNHRELRAQLEAKGRVFRSGADTEVLLHLYAERGPDMVRMLRGMYAFAIWDEQEKTLFLARDPFGVKPLYYADDGVSLRFASQVKALLAGGAVNAAPEPAGAVGFLLWGCVPEPFTLYRGVRALPAGHCLSVRRGAPPRLTVHFDLREELLRAQEDARPFGTGDREALAGALRDTVGHHLISDVPVGVFLSAGIDSTLLTALAAEQSGVSLRTLTLGFEEYRGTGADEVPLAQQTAALRGTRHETSWIGREDFERELEAVLAAMDQPSTDGVNTYFVCREAARAGLKVALSGLGGDELFGGYPSFRDVPRLARWLRPARLSPLAARAARRALAPLVCAFSSPKYASLLEYGGSVPGAYLLRRALFMPWEVSEVLDPAAAHAGLERLSTLRRLADGTRDVRGAHAQVLALEVSWYMRNQLLRDADWASMAHSVEVRVPFVDVALFRAMSRWLASEAPPRKADAAAAPRAALGPHILNRRKSGFSVPVGEWLAKKAGASGRAQRGLRGWALRVLPPQPRQFRVLALVTDAFGGTGGIAQFTRDLLQAVAAMPGCAEVVAVPRHVRSPPGPLPSGVSFVTRAAGGKLRFAAQAMRQGCAGPFDLVIAGHINLAPLAALIARARGARVVLAVYGIDAWTPHRSALVRSSLAQFDRILGISKLTLQRFGQWANVSAERFRLLPCCVNMNAFTPGPRPEALARRLGLAGRTVIMTLGRLDGDERYKGFDEVIEVLPELAREHPQIAYLICGDGPDRARLEAKAAALGLGERVVFAGFVPEAEKGDYYRLADAYVMPSSGEGFGIVLLEALACGVPALGSATDGGREALRDGTLGILVDPSRREELRAGILGVLRRGKGVPRELDHFSERAYAARAAGVVHELLASR